MPRAQPLHWNTPVSDGRPEEGNMGGNLKSLVIDWNSKPGALQIQWSGTPTGSFTIWASNDHDPRKIDWNGKWTSINSLIAPPLTAPAGSAGDMWIDIPLRPAFLYVEYTRSAGSGTLQGDISQER